MEAAQRAHVGVAGCSCATDNNHFHYSSTVRDRTHVNIAREHFKSLVPKCSGKKLVFNWLRIDEENTYLWRRKRAIACHNACQCERLLLVNAESIPLFRLFL